MANQEHLEILKQGVKVWNDWRKINREIVPDLSGANLIRANLSGANLNKAYLRETRLVSADLSGARLDRADLGRAKLSGANLSGAILRGAFLGRANLGGSDLSAADLSEASLSGANFSNANLSGANLSEADLAEANLSNANLRGANLSYSLLVRTNFEKAELTNCRVYGVSAWDLCLQGTEQVNLCITREGEPVITVDNLKVAQFIYLLLTNPEVREIIDTITSKVVLILGRFTPERKAALDAIREELRHSNYTPVLFDFERPASRDLTETISTLAHMARFIIADITDPRSIPQELATIVPHLPSVAIQPLIEGSSTEYGMFEHFKRYPWVLEIHRYHDLDDLLATLGEKVVTPAETKVAELRQK